MATGILKPLAVFCSQAQYRQFIKYVRNMGDTRHTLTYPPTDDHESTVIDTAFDFILKITYKSGRMPESDTKPSDIESVEMIQSDPAWESILPMRHYRMFPNHGTEFIWRQAGDVRIRETSDVDADEVLSGYPPSVTSFYDIWVSTYSDLCDKRGDEALSYSAPVFPTVVEEVAWHVAGYLLAWRIVMGPEVGSVEYCAGRSKYMLKRGQETSATLKFLKDQAKLLAKG